MGDQTSVLTSGAATTWVAVVTEGLGTAEASSSLESYPAPNKPDMANMFKCEEALSSNPLCDKKVELVC